MAAVATIGWGWVTVCGGELGVDWGVSTGIGVLAGRLVVSGGLVIGLDTLLSMCVKYINIEA